MSCGSLLISGENFGGVEGAGERASIIRGVLTSWKLWRPRHLIGVNVLLPVPVSLAVTQLYSAHSSTSSE